MASILLIRHADAGDREEWDGDDRLRPLSPKGWKQAEGLVETLRAEPVIRVLSSPYLRCRQTVEPLARARRLRVMDADALAEGSPWEDALRLIVGLGQPGAMCSQGDVIGYLVEALVDRGLVEPQDARWKKASTWRLDVEGDEVVKATYLPPP